jgi:hypothetical protein
MTSRNEAPPRRRNLFTILAESDTESELEQEIICDIQTVENSIIIEPVVENQQQFRTWTRDESEQRFTNEEIKGNIFSSPFSKTKHIQKQWSKPRFREDNDGWVSIRWSQPQFQDNFEVHDEVSAKDQTQDKVQVEESQFPSLLTRGDSVKQSQEDNISAVVWAEKIKKNLERAELTRCAKARENSQKFIEPFGRLSFFRRPMVVESQE